MAVHLLERGIPDLIDTSGLDPVVAAEVDFLAGRVEAVSSTESPAVRARAATLGGDAAGAVALLDEAMSHELRGHTLTAACWAASRVGSVPLIERLLARLAAEPDLLVDGNVPLGPRTLAEGPLVAAMGDLGAAAKRLQLAVGEGDARAPLWGALARVELARVLRCRQAVGAFDPTSDANKVRQVENAARLFFRAGGYRSLAERLIAMLDPISPARVLGAPTAAYLSPGPTWAVGFGVMAPVSVAPSKGLLALRHLVEQSGRGVPATVLDAVAAGRVPELTPAVLADAIEQGDEGVIRQLSDEAARNRIDKLLRRTMVRLAERHPILGTHLQSTVRLGHVCGYEPVGGVAITWRTDDDSSGVGPMSTLP